MNIKILGTPAEADKDLAINPHIFSQGVALNQLLSEEASRALAMERFQTLTLGHADKMIHVQMLKARALEELNQNLPPEKLEVMEIEDFQSVYKHYLKIHESMMAKIKGELSSLSVVSGVIQGINIKFHEVQAALQEKARERARIKARKILYFINQQNSSIQETNREHCMANTMGEQHWSRLFSSLVSLNNFDQGIKIVEPLLSIQSDIYKITDSKVKEDGEFLCVTSAFSQLHPIWEELRDTNNVLPLLIAGANRMADSTRQLHEFVKNKIHHFVASQPDEIAEIKESYGIDHFNVTSTDQQSGVIRIIKRLDTLEQTREFSRNSIDFLKRLTEIVTFSENSINESWIPTAFYTNNEEEIERLWSERNDTNSREPGSV